VIACTFANLLLARAVSAKEIGIVWNKVAGV
jgi:hypothetical protein